MHMNQVSRLYFAILHLYVTGVWLKQILTEVKAEHKASKTKIVCVEFVMLVYTCILC